MKNKKYLYNKKLKMLEWKQEVSKIKWCLIIILDVGNRNKNKLIKTSKKIFSVETYKFLTHKNIFLM